jgi:hypothetical protein
METANLPPESVERVAEMCRLRRERQLADQQVWEQDARLRQEQQRFAAELIASLVDEETHARALVLRSENIGFDRLIAQRRAATSAGASSKASHEHIAEVRRSVQAATFRQFWQNRKVGAANFSPSAPEGAELRRNAVTVLRHAYAHSAPPFAADPEDLWKRGVIVPPDFQRGAQATPAAIQLDLPAYHDFALAMRNKYAASKSRPPVL